MEIANEMEITNEHSIDLEMHESKLNSFLKSEAVLDSDFQYAPFIENNLPPKAIFLTGATGFLGAFLLNELLCQTSADIYCLVRSRDNKNNPKERIKENLKFCMIWNEMYDSRIIPVSGDLSKPFLGLSEFGFNQLAEKIDLICHNGAQVNSVYSYSDLKAVNVSGTQEIIRLAGVKRTKPLHFISTLAVFLSNAYSDPNKVVMETDTPIADSGLKGGYRQSKWAAEQMLMNAQELGLPISIYRISRVMGHSKTGVIGNFKDFLCTLIKASIELGKYPALPTIFNLTPVDYASQAVVHILQQKQSLGRAFHILNPYSITSKKLFENICSLGYPLKEISYQDWSAEIKKYSNNRFYVQLRFLLNSPNALLVQKPKFDAADTLERLKSASIVCPQLDLELLKTYFLYFHKSGYITFPKE